MIEAEYESKIKELEDKIYHLSREEPETRYILENKLREAESIGFDKAVGAMRRSATSFEQMKLINTVVNIKNSILKGELK